MLMFLPILPIFCLLILVGITVFIWRTFRRASTSMARRVVAVLSAAVVGIPVMLCMLFAVYMTLFWSGWALRLKNATDRRQRLILYQTDHRAVLEAGRQMLADTNAYPTYPENTNLPKVLRDLEPNYVLIADDRSKLDVEMGGGFFHFGYTIYRDDMAGRGEKQLLPGLWYYSEGGKVIPPKK